MLKRIIFSLLVFLAAIFVPYWLGKLVPISVIDNRWFVGLLYIIIITTAVLFIRGCIKLFKWIKNG